MKKLYYLSVLFVVGIVIGVVIYVRHSDRQKKIHRQLVYEESILKEKNKTDSSNSTDSFNMELDEENLTTEIVLPVGIRNLTGVNLKESHTKQFSKRYKPYDYIYNSPKMEQYLGSLGENIKGQAREKRRIKILSSLKPCLITYLSKNTYEGKITLSDKTVLLNSNIAMANDNVVIIHTGKSSKEYSWSKLAPVTIVSMLQYFAGIREKSQRAYGQTEKEHEIQVADDYLLAAVFCDWYGNYSGAVRFLKKAISLNPELTEFAEKIFLD